MRRYQVSPDFYLIFTGEVGNQPGTARSYDDRLFYLDAAQNQVFNIVK